MKALNLKSSGMKLFQFPSWYYFGSKSKEIDNVSDLLFIELSSDRWANVCSEGAGIKFPPGQLFFPHESDFCVSVMVKDRWYVYWWYKDECVCSSWCWFYRLRKRYRTDIFVPIYFIEYRLLSMYSITGG